MTLDNRREQERLARESRILDAARDLLIEKGLAVMTMDEVAARADFTKRTLYAYFPGKEELYAALITWALTELNDCFRTALTLPGTGLERISRVGSAFVDFSREHPKSFAVLSRYQNVFHKGETMPAYPALMEQNRINLTLMADTIAQGVADGSIRPDCDPMLSAVYLARYSTAIVATTHEAPGLIEHVLRLSDSDFMLQGMEFISRALANPSTRR